MRNIVLLFTSTPTPTSTVTYPYHVPLYSEKQSDSPDKLAEIFTEIRDFKKSAKEQLALAKFQFSQDAITTDNSGTVSNTNTIATNDVTRVDDDVTSMKEDPYAEEREQITKEYLMNHNLDQLKSLIRQRLQQSSKSKSYKGNKPDIALKLANLDLLAKYQVPDGIIEVNDARLLPVKNDNDIKKETSDYDKVLPLIEFAGISNLSIKAGTALSIAQFLVPTPIQSVAIPFLYAGNSAILHAETGSGKTLTYLLPITEQLLLASSRRKSRNNTNTTTYNNNGNVCLIITPTRELAAQVAGVASALLPKRYVQLVRQPCNLMELSNDNQQQEKQRVIIGSAKAILTSLYGNGKLPASPTPKPLVSKFLKSIRWLVMDEVDKLLNVKQLQKKKHNNGNMSKKKMHEKPAALLATAIARTELGIHTTDNNGTTSSSSRRVQIIAASATVGRPMRREFTRVFGLTPAECPDVIRSLSNTDNISDSATSESVVLSDQNKNLRAVTIPSTVRNYYSEIRSTSDNGSGSGGNIGALLVHASSVIKKLPDCTNRKILLVLTKNCGMNIANTLGALRHFNGKSLIFYVDIYR